MGRTRIAVGTPVGARRWPYPHHRTAPPYRGVVLAQDDPRAWAESIAFPGTHPAAEDVKAHVTRCVAEGTLTGLVPVLWDFRANGRKVHWQRIGGQFPIRTYAEDLADWEAELAAEEARQAA